MKRTARLQAAAAAFALLFSTPCLAAPEEAVLPAGEGGEGMDAAPPAPPPSALTKPAKPANPSPGAINAVRLQGLNKVTARVSVVTAPLGTVARFDNLEIIAQRCWKSPPEAQPENAALLEIRELKPEETPHTVFQGWMFSSAPALSALEHPVYDISVLACEHAEAAE